MCLDICVYLYVQQMYLIAKIELQNYVYLSDIPNLKKENLFF